MAQAAQGIPSNKVHLKYGRKYFTLPLNINIYEENPVIFESLSFKKRQHIKPFKNS